MKILCKTLFDCSPTGVTGHFRPSAIPFRDNTGKEIANLTAWNFSRNQQRNWETINQLISLRTQPVDIAPAAERNGVWQFVFEVEQPLVYSTTGAVGDFGALISECAGVPMIVGLNETRVEDSTLITEGPDANIWFESINTALE